MYFNTTTIPTYTENESSLLKIIYILSLGAMVGASVIELFLFRLREKERDSVETDEEEEAAAVNYCNNYQDEFASLPLRKLSEDELKQLNTKIVREQVAEQVEVIMTFDKTTDTFWYYTDKLKEVSYPILETVARKFAIDNDCKIICLQEQEVLVEAPTTEEPITEAPITEAPITEAPAIFAKFKSYNAGKGSAPNFTSVVKVIEQINHFRYRGKIVDYEESQKPNKEEPTLDYASYKKLLEKKEK